MDYRKTAKEILNHVGGSKNIVSAAHCATRLRLVIADNSKADKTALLYIFKRSLCKRWQSLPETGSRAFCILLGIFNSDCYTIASIIVFPSIVISLMPVSFFLLKLKLIIYPFFTW